MAAKQIITLYTKAIYPFLPSLFLLFCIVTFLFSPSPVLAESTTTTLPHMADFLTLPICNGCGTTWYPRASASERTLARQQMKDKGYTHWYLSVSSGSHNFYGNPSGFRTLLEELVNDDIKPIVWLTSDTGSWKDQLVSSINQSLTNFIPQIDSLANSYVLGIEIDEYWTLSESNQIGAHLDSLTSKPLADHQLPGKSDRCTSWCDYLIYQYGFGKTESQIKSMTMAVIDSLGKPVVAGEYNLDESNEALSIKLGNAAVSAGASGFGNGGTPFSNLPTPTPKPSLSPNPSPTPAPNTPPIAQNQEATTSPNTPIELQLQFTQDDGPGPYSYQIITPPTHGTLTGSNNDRVYTPASGFTGTDSFTWRVSDSLVWSNQATYTLTVSPLLMGDLDHDGDVDIFDYNLLVQHFNTTNCTYNLTGSCLVDIFDYNLLIQNFSQ